MKPAARLAVPFVVAMVLAAAPPVPAAVRDEIAAARGAYERGAWDEARRVFSDITGRQGDDGDAREAWYYLALLTRAGDEYLSDLEQYLDHGGRRDPRAPYVELRAGRYYYSLGEYRAALTRFETARELRHEDAKAVAEARYWVGLTLMALREPAEARRSLESAAVATSPAGIREGALFALGELLRTTRDLAAAARAYAACREAFPNGDYVAASLFGEATARDLLGRKKDAADLYRMVVTSYADYPEAAQARAWLKAAEAPGAAAGKEPETPARAAGPSGSAPAGGAADTSGGVARGAAAAPSGELPPPPPADGRIGYSVQVGAFASEENALRLADDLLGRGYSRVRLERGTEEPRLYHVRFGSYADQSRAVRAGEEVSATLGLKFQIVPPPEPGQR